MKTPLQNLIPLAALIASGLLLTAHPAKAVNYAGNGDTSFGGDIGNGTLSLTDDGTNIYGSLVVGNGNNMYNALVIYVDTGAGGGFNTTTNFNDQNDSLRIGISGVSGSGRSVMTFTNGFAPQYAIALGPQTASFGGLWKLANGGNNSLIYVNSANLNPVGTTSGPFTFSIQATDLGLTNNTLSSIKIFGTYISNSGYRSSEAIAGNAAGSAGWNPFTQTAFATYNFAAPPAPSYPVTFQVDMTAKITSGDFDPNAGDTVYATGTFQTNAWSGQAFPLSPTVGNTNIYTGTYADFNPAGTAEFFKFNYVHLANASTNFEGVDNRPFTQQANAQTLPLVYFDNLFPSPSATTNNVTFSIDMTTAKFFGTFDPNAGDEIQVLGTFENPKWTIGGLILTNDPTSLQSNIYSGTIADGNYPGTFENYKFVVHKTGGDTYESGNNRIFYTPTNAGVLPLAYFNNIFSIYSIPVTFQVDMTVPLLTGEFNPSGNGDTVSAAGTFQTNQWTAGAFTLAPSDANPNIYIGTYVDYHAPGTGEQFKFQINPAGNGASASWESVNNRTFTLSANAQTNPVVFWNNLNTNQVTLQATTIKFTVNMDNAVDVFGNPFDPGNDRVLVNGDFVTPTWPVNWTDPAIDSDYGAYFLANDPSGSPFYTGTFIVPAGHSLEVQYKYGIFHNTSAINTNADNEASAYLNHTRYIRAMGSYNFPTDIFGIQQTNLPAATEPAFGNLAIGSPAAGIVPITWLGLPSVHLQTSTNLTNPVWQDQTDTTGLSATNWPMTSGAQFFRLIQN